MKRNYALIVTVVVLALLSSASEVIAQEPTPPRPSPAQVEASTLTVLGTAFTFQGQLKKDGVPVNGICDMQFGLWDVPSGGTLALKWTSPIPTSVTNGLFTAQVDFGEQQLTGDARWLEIRVRCLSDYSYTILTPRQPLTPAPYALALPGLYTRQNTTSPNLIGGHSRNVISSTVVGGTIGGGGAQGQQNQVWDDYATVGGGVNNVAGGFLSTVGGGTGNTVLGSSAIIGGGIGNKANADVTTVAGGSTNRAAEDYATIGGGSGNVASGNGAFVGGGGYDGTYFRGNTASGNLAVVAGGAGNSASGYGAVVGGGGGYSGSTIVSNTASANWATVGGGARNVASGAGSTIPGGNGNLAQGANSFAAGTQARALHPGAFVWGDGQYVDFSSTGNNQFLIRATGGVGIGTNAPGASVHIAGTNSTLRIQSTANNVWPRTMYQTDARQWDTGVGGSAVTNDLNGKYYVFDATVSQTRMVVDTNGNVGMGTTSPNQKLVVNGSALTRVAIDSTSGGNAGIQLRQGGTSRWALATVETNGDFQIYEDDAGINRFYISGAGPNQGNVGIGTMNPTAKLDVAGTMASKVVQIRGGGDLAEKFDVSSETPVEPGTLMVIDERTPGRLKPSDQAYDTKVAGIVSGAGGVQPGLTLQQEGVMDGNTSVAIAGRVYVRAEALSAPIKPGDLLTSSSIPGYAMKATDRDRAPGAIIGKAMSELVEGTGLVLVLVNLQ